MYLYTLSGLPCPACGGAHPQHHKIDFVACLHSRLILMHAAKGCAESAVRVRPMHGGPLNGVERRLDEPRARLARMEPTPSLSVLFGPSLRTAEEIGRGRPDG